MLPRHSHPLTLGERGPAGQRLVKQRKKKSRARLRNCNTPTPVGRRGGGRTMGYQAWFQCQKGCDERYSLYEVVYHCKKCGSLLEVVHDMEALRDRSAQQWKDLFDTRYMRTSYPYGSAIWGKME